MNEHQDSRDPISDEPSYEVDPDLALAEQAEAPARSRHHRDPQLRLIATIAVGGAIGGAARYLVEEALRPEPPAWPWATWTVNVTGCFLIGVLMVVVVDVIPGQRYVRPFLGVGILGGYTTFSTFMVDTDKLVYDGRVAIAALYAATSILAGLFGVYLGLVVGRIAIRITPRLRLRHLGQHENQ